MTDDPRWWKLYREERGKLGLVPSDRPSDSQVVRAAREATRRYDNGGGGNGGGGNAGDREPRKTPPPGGPDVLTADPPPRPVS